MNASSDHDSKSTLKSTQDQSDKSNDRPTGGWTALIDEIVEGKWVNPETGKPAELDYDTVVIDDSLEGREAELIAGLNLGEKLAVVCDENTYDAMGGRVAKALKSLGSIDTVVLDHPHADEASVADLKGKLAGYDGVVAVGSGTINDLCKYVTGLDGRRYAVFGTAGSMNGYTSSTASITLESGLKVSLPSHAPSGTYIDLKVCSDAPSYLSAAGFGDCLCRSVAQVDWWLSHRLFDTFYASSPFAIQVDDERELNARVTGIANNDIAANGYLFRVLILCGLGVGLTGTSHHGSMGEHQISHYIDCFAGDAHPGTLHGEQVGVASLTMARMQQEILLASKPPIVKATTLDIADMERRFGKTIAAQCYEEITKKALDDKAADLLNEKLAELWPVLQEELKAFMIPVSEMEKMLKDTGGSTTYKDLGISADFYRETIAHCKEMRNRYSVLDLVADADLMDDFIAREVQ